MEVFFFWFAISLIFLVIFYMITKISINIYKSVINRSKIYEYQVVFLILLIALSCIVCGAVSAQYRFTKGKMFFSTEIDWND